MAGRLSEGLAGLPGVVLSHPVESNQIFARRPEAMIQGLFERGFEFYRWGPEASRLEDNGPEDNGPEDTGPEDTGPEDTGPEDTGEVRLVAAFDTDPAHVAAFLAAARELAEAGDDAR